MNIKFIISFLSVIQFSLFFISDSYSAEYKFFGGATKPANGGRINAAIANCVPGTSSKELDINNVRARYMNQGDMFWDPAASQPRYEVPKVTDNSSTKKNSVFAAAIWLGGIEKGTSNVVVMAQTYRGDGFRNYWPGPIRKYNLDTSFTKAAICLAWDQHFKCNRQTVRKFVDDFDAGLIADCETDIPEEIRLWPGKGNPFLKQNAKFQSDPDAVASINNNLANFYDRDKNSIYNPCNGDFPLWAGTEAAIECNPTDTLVNINAGADQVIWWVCNDVGNNKSFPENTSLVPGLGMEIHYEAFAYASTDATNDMTFLRQKLFNKGNFTLENTYLAQWMDPDLGNPSDDYVGCDVLRGLGICYNGDDDDEGGSGYGVNPPAVAVDFFRGPFPDNKFDEIDWDLDCRGPSSAKPDTDERIVMSGFIYYNLSNSPVNGEPDRYNDFYNLLQNRWKNGQPVSFGGDGTAPAAEGKGARYMFPNVTEQSDPYGFACTQDPKAIKCVPKSCGSSWNEKTAGNAPGDRRFLANNGPFTLMPGAVNECTIGIVWARATSGGATGSFGKLLAADDLAQERFDLCFKRYVGPNNPNLDISELDRTLIFKILPDTIVNKPLMTTETYSEENKAVSAGAELQDVFYRFQGYKIYQLFDDKVSVQDLDNPDKARLLDGDVDGDSVTDFNGLMDIADNVKTIKNLEFNPDLDVKVLTPKVVNSPDKGIFNSFQVTRDMFSNLSGGKISNFKKYYYAVVAYGYNANSQAERPYIQGVLNYKIYTAIPHKVNPESFGTLLNANFGDGFEITKVSGLGNSGRITDIDSIEEKNIFERGKVDRIRYLPKRGPIDIKVYNPKSLVASSFQIKFSGRISYKIENYKFKEGDIIEASDDYAINEKDVLTPVPNSTTSRLNYGYRLNFRKKYKKGIAKVLRVIPNEADLSIVDLDIEAVGCDVGDFSYKVDKIGLSEGRNSILDTIILSTREVGCKFWLQGDTGSSATVREFNQFDYWKLTDLKAGKSVYNNNPISKSAEELLPEYGISIRPKNGVTPGSNPFNLLELNGVIESEIKVDEDPNKIWTIGKLGSNRSDKLADQENYYAIDPFGNFKTMVNGSWGPYILGKFAESDKRIPTPGKWYTGGPQMRFRNDDIDTVFELSRNIDGKANKYLLNTHNVNVVLTNDQSKWTRCVVLQNDSIDKSVPGKGSGQGYILAKSRRPSVNKSFVNDNSRSIILDDTIASRGMSWFPGYAVDIDRGIRLNIIFSESMLSDASPTGNDLQWKPDFPTSTNPSGSYIYILNDQYDEGKKAEKFLDSLYIAAFKKGGSANVKANNILPHARLWHLRNIMYYGSMISTIDFNNFSIAKPLISKVTIRLRVQRAFDYYSSSGGNTDCSPTYEFSTEGSTSKFVSGIGQSAMDLIRVVPNPYLSISGYENSQIDSRVKVVNLPTQCVVSIFNLSGTLVRQFNFNQADSKPYASVGDGVANTKIGGDNFQTYLEWDLKNQNGVPISSGVYIIHVNSKKFGDKVIKWFGVLRPIDLDSFN